MTQPLNAGPDVRPELSDLPAGLTNSPKNSIANVTCLS